MQVGQLESQLQMKESALADLQNRYDNIDKQNAQLLGFGSENNKLSHFNQIKKQNNQDIKKLYETQQELARKNKELQRYEKLINENAKHVSAFTDQASKILGFTKGSLRRWEECPQEFLAGLMEIIKRNVNQLQLETPNNIAAQHSKQSEQISASSSSDQVSSSF